MILNTNNEKIKIKSSKYFWEIYNENGEMINSYMKELEKEVLEKILIKKGYKIIK